MLKCRSRLVGQYVRPSSRLGNPLVCESGLMAVHGDETVLVGRVEGGMECRFPGLQSVRCVALHAGHLLIFEQHAFSLLRQESSLAWTRLVAADVAFFAFDCEVRVDDTSIVILAASVCGLHVWTVDREARTMRRQIIFPGHSISSVVWARDTGNVALATLDGHFGIWSFEALLACTNLTAGSSFLWFAESGGRITSVTFDSTETRCGVVCWDGMGVIFEARDDGTWVATRHFSRSRVFGPQETSLGSPALGAWTDEKRFHVILRNAMKTYFCSALDTDNDDELVFNSVRLTDEAESGTEDATSHSAADVWGLCATSGSSCLRVDCNGRLTEMSLSVEQE